jgi:hypothetical protein
MNASTANILIGSASALTGAVVAGFVAKKVLEKKPELAPVVIYVGGLFTGAGIVLLTKNNLTTKSEAGAILAAG